MKLRSIKSSLLLGIVLLAHAAAGHAEHADRGKPVHLESDRVSINDVSHVSVFSGNVVLTQGTLVIRGDQLVVRQDKNGFKHGTATGNLASFRQKREGLDEYVEGYGERIEYDTGSTIMEIFGHARVKRGEDDVRGEHITYDSRTGIFQVSSAPGSKEAPASGQEQRVRMVIQPKNKQTPAEPHDQQPLSIKPDTMPARPEKNP
jgi:lipopolysaccharide export system protein LptA